MANPLEKSEFIVILINTSACEKMECNPIPDKPEPSRLLSLRFSACPEIRNQKLETNDN
jgi:hypothetical protein